MGFNSAFKGLILSVGNKKNYGSFLALTVTICILIVIVEE